MPDFAFINGTTLHYVLDGAQDAPPLVLLHSLGTDLHLWDEVVAQLRDYHILRFDLRGHGRSDITDAALTIGDLSSDVCALLDQMRIEQAAVVGISAGGLVAMDFALQYSRRLSALVLCDTAPRIGSPALWDERIAAVGQRGMAAMAETILARWFAPDFKARQPALYSGYKNMVSRMSAGGYARLCEVLRDTDLTGEVGRIQARTLTVCGALDVATPPEQAQALARAIPGAHAVEIAGAAHLPPVEQPAATAAVLTRFFEERDDV